MGFNRYRFQFGSSLERDVLHLYAQATINGSGDAVSDRGLGIASITKMTPGVYRVTLTDPVGIIMHVTPIVELNKETIATIAFQDVTFTAVTPGAAGNSITVAFVVSGNNTPLSVGVAGSAITVNVETDGGGLPLSTKAEVVAAILASGPASALITASVPLANEDEVVAAEAITNLAGGVDAGFVNVFVGGKTTQYVDIRSVNTSGVSTNLPENAVLKVKLDCRLTSYNSTGAIN